MRQTFSVPVSGNCSFLEQVKARTINLEIRTPSGALLLRAIRSLFFSQHGTSTASLVYNLERYQWSDGQWMELRRGKNWPQSPISVYEVHLGSWRRKTEKETGS